MELDGNGQSITLRTVGDTQFAFTFDRVFGPEASQQEVYAAAAAPLLADVLQGYNGCLLAYGQTGAGKTFTMVSAWTRCLVHMPRCVSLTRHAAAAAAQEGELRVPAQQVSPTNVLCCATQ